MYNGPDEEPWDGIGDDLGLFGANVKVTNHESPVNIFTKVTGAADQHGGDDDRASVPLPSCVQCHSTNRVMQPSTPAQVVSAAMIGINGCTDLLWKGKACGTFIGRGR